MDVIEIARKKLAELEREATELRRFVATYEALRGEKSQNYEIRSPDLVTNEPDQIGIGNADSPFRKRGDKPSEIVEAAIKVIRDSGRPMTRSQLVKALEEEGMTIGGTDKSKNMGTILWRSKKFENVEGEGYWPHECGAWDLSIP